jgi:hypothetical protein
METSFAERGLDWRVSMNQFFTAYATPGDDRFSQALLADTTSQIGVGFWSSGDEAWFALSFE